MRRLLQSLLDWTYRSDSLNEIELKLRPYLDFERGFFIEAGANDGLRQSNTLFLERRRAWRGLLVEPIPELAAACRRNRRRSIVESVALVPKDFAESTVQMHYVGLMSLVKGAMKSEEAEKEHVRAGEKVQEIRAHQVTVPTASLSALLDKHHIEQIDFLSLDVEGFELSALRGMELERHHPTYLLIEARYRAEVEAYLSTHYEAVADFSHHDVLYRYRGGRR